MISKVKDDSRTKVKFCGLTVYKFQKNPYKKEFLKWVFRVKTTLNADAEEVKKYYILGINYKTTRKKIQTCYPANDQFPSALSPSFLRVAIIADIYIPQCKLYRVNNRVRALEDLGYSVMVCDWRDSFQSITSLQTVDFVIFYRVPYFDIVKNYYEEATRLGLKKYFDIDDLIFDRKLYEDYIKNLNFSEKEMQNLLYGCNLYFNSLKNSDYFLCTTRKLQQLGKQIKEKSSIIPNCIPDSLYKISENLKKI